MSQFSMLALICTMFVVWRLLYAYPCMLPVFDVFYSKQTENLATD